MKKYIAIAFDVDGTLINLGEKENIWQALEEEINVNIKINQEIYREFIAGKISYSEWALKVFNEYVKKGLTKEVFNKAIENIKPMPEALETILELKKRGYKLAIVSGSIDLALEKFIPLNLFNYTLINKLYFENEKPHFTPTPYGHGIYKAMGLKKIAKKENITLDKIVYIGDGENDLEAFKIAGLSIIYYPRKKLKEKIPYILKNYKIINQNKNLKTILQIIK